MNLPEVSPQLRIWQLGLGFANTAVLHTLVKTGVIEQMRHQPKTLAELAQVSGQDPDVLYRVLRFAVAIGVVDYNENQFSLTETGTFLLKDVPGSLYTGVLLFGSEAWQRAWQNLEYSLTTGEVAFEHVMGNSFFKYLDENPEYGSPFHQWMTIMTAQVADAITEVYDFIPFNSVCDIGGGQGLLLKNILIANPHLHGILYEQESVISDHILTDMNGRVEIQIGNFFERVPTADLLLMSRIIHDWNDENCQVILSHCRRAMQTSSRLLIIDRVIESPTDAIGLFYDLHMHLILGGRERTEREFNLLLGKAGLRLNRIIPTESPLKIIEASI